MIYGYEDQLHLFLLKKFFGNIEFIYKFFVKTSYSSIPVQMFEKKCVDMICTYMYVCVHLYIYEYFLSMYILLIDDAC